MIIRRGWTGERKERSIYRPIEIYINIAGVSSFPLKAPGPPRFFFARCSVDRKNLMRLLSLFLTQAGKKLQRTFNNVAAYNCARQTNTIATARLRRVFSRKKQIRATDPRRAGEEGEG